MSHVKQARNPLDAGSTEALTSTIASSLDADFSLTKALNCAGSINDLLGLYDLLTTQYGIDCKKRMYNLVDRTKALSKDIRPLGVGGEAKEILIAAQTPQIKESRQITESKEFMK
jgi:hypothetical protein